MMGLSEFLDQAFAPGGALASLLPEYRENPQQRAYAADVASLIEKGGRGGDTAVGVIEAETGTGKTLGYLLPAAWVAAQGRRVVVSTFTNHLLRQALDEAWPIVREVSEHLLGVSLAAAPRIGAVNFVSPQRARDALAEVVDPDPALLATFENWLESGSGVIRDWIDQYGELPFGLSAAAICCTSRDASEAVRYQAHLERARSANVVFTNHALSILHAKGLRLLDGEQPVSLMIFDEADRVESAAESLLSKRVSLRDLQRLGRSLPGADDDPRLSAQAGAFLAAVHACWDRLDRARESLSSSEQSQLVETEGQLLLDELNLLMEKIGTGAPEPWLETAASLHYLLEGIVLGAGEERHMTAILNWSEKRKIPSLHVVALDPARIVARMTRLDQTEGHLSALLLTSATLGGGREDDLIAVARRFGFFGGWSAVLARRFQPPQFGRMTFVLMDDALPSPTGSSDGESDPQWLDNIATMIRDAHAEGGRVLALTLSRRDTLAIAERLDLPVLLVHGGDVRLNQLLETFRADERSVLLSPAAWEGVDLPGLIQHLVLTRLPYRPPNNPHSIARREALVQAGYPSVIAERIVYARDLEYARQRFRQGLGRGIRRASDQVQVWIGDPRFLHSPFVSAVPERFREASVLGRAPLEQARIWHPDGMRDRAEATRPFHESAW